MLWCDQYFNGKMLRSFFQKEMKKLNILETRTFLVATDLTFPFHLAMKKWIQTVIPAVHTQISLWCPLLVIITGYHRIGTRIRPKFREGMW